MIKASPMLLVLLFSFVFASPEDYQWYKDEHYHCGYKHFTEHPSAEHSCYNHCPPDADCYDYIVVGLGAGGGVIAGRLAQECRHTTLGLDLGSPVFDTDLVTVPRYYLFNWNEPDNWKTTLPYRTVPQQTAGGVTKNYIRGRGWGGSTTINGQVHVRGTKKNFDDWSDIIGDETWDFEHVLPVFKKIENNVWHKDSIWHGTRGFNTVSRVLQDHDEWVDPKNYEVWNSITSAGIPYVNDIHGDPKTYAGLSYCSASVGFDPVTGHGTRSWVGKDLLKPAAEKCRKLRIKSRTLVTRVLFDGIRAVGVEYIEGEGIYSTEVNSTLGIRNRALHNKKFAFARRGVIVAAGTVNTPQLLKLSGIGPRAELEKFHIPVVVDLPGVGENLQDHVEFTVNYKFDSPTYIDSLGCSYGTRDANDPCATQYNRYYGTNGRVGNLDWNFDKKGDVECHAIMSTDYPIWDFDHLPTPSGGPFPVPGIFGWLNEIMNPSSRGSITLQSADPTEAPFIDPRYYSHPDDLRKAVGCWNLIEGIMGNVSHVELFRPDPASVTTDKGVEDYLKNVAWGHHMTSTARMGRRCDKMAVLDTNLRPFGTQNLYVVDASAIPKIVSGQPTFAVYMLAQKAFWKIKNFERTMHNCEGTYWHHF